MPPQNSPPSRSGPHPQDKPSPRRTATSTLSSGRGTGHLARGFPDQVDEKFPHRRIARRSMSLGMKLHAEHANPRIERLDRLDDSIARAGRRTESGRHIAHGLMMERVRPQRIRPVIRRTSDSSATATACVASLEGRDWLWLTERSAYSLGRSWYSVPPKATLISCSPRQMPSTGISRRRARSSNAKSYASRTVSTCPSAAEGSASKRAGSTSPPPISTKPSSRSNKRLRQAVSLISGMTTGIPPAASTAST